MPSPMPAKEQPPGTPSTYRGWLSLLHDLLDQHWGPR